MENTATFKMVLCGDGGTVRAYFFILHSRPMLFDALANLNSRVCNVLLF